MNINDIVFSFKNKIGIIIAKKGLDTYTIKYESITTDENEADLIKISDDIIEVMSQSRYKDFLPIKVLEKGKEYYIDNKVKDLVVADRNITANVIGTNNYSTNIIITKTNIRTKCSCPVGSMCKHIAATLFDLDNKLSHIINTPAKKDEKISFKDILESAVRINPKLNQYKDLIYIESITNGLSGINTDKDLELFLNELESFRTNTNIYNETKKIVYEILAFSNINLDDIDSFYKNTKAISYIKAKRNISIDSLIRNYYLSNDDIKDVILYSITTKKYEYYFGVLKEISSNDHHIRFLLDRYNDSVLKDLINKDLLYLLKRDITRKLFEISDDISKTLLVNNTKQQIVNVSDLEGVDVSLGLDMISNINDESQIAKYIIDNYKYFGKYNKKELYEASYRLLKGKLRSSLRSSIEALLDDDPNARYLVAIINKDNIMVDDIELFKSIFDISYDIYDDNDELHENYYLSINKERVLEFEIINGEKYYHLMDNYFNAILLILSQDMEYNNRLRLAKNSILNKKTEELTRIYLNEINNLDVSFKSRRIISDEAKIKIEYSFEKVNEYSKRFGDYSLAFKVSSLGRTYIVKDALSFLNNIEKGKTFKYGKELEFNHRIENFREEDRKVLEYLLNIQLTYDHSSSRYIYLSERCFENLIELLKSRIIYFNDKEFFVRLNNVSFNTYINSNYELSNGYSKDSIIFGINKLYLIDNGYIDNIDISIDYKDFVLFSQKNNGMNIALVKDTFINRVYSRYNNLIDVDDSISDDFDISELKIDAYFDFNKGVIIVETRVYKSDVLLTSDAFLNEVDKNRLLIYKEYLEDLGFIDNMLSDTTKILSFLRMDFSILKKLCNVYLSDSILNKTLSGFSAPTVRIKYENSMMEAFLSQSDYTDEELYQILKAIRLHKNYVLLNENRIVTLDNDETNEFLDTVNDLKLDIKELSKPKRLMIYEALKAYSHLENCNIDEYVTKMIEDIRNYKNLEYEMPNINATLREYQNDGFKWLKTLSKYHLGGILADDMGLGKTLEVITMLKSDNELKPSLVVCPKSLIYNWYSEVNKFDGETKITLIYGQSNERHKIIKNIDSNNKHIYVTAYDSLRNDLDCYKDIKFNYIILDEAQAIKNVNAIKSISVKMLDGINRIALTGTPIENNIIDLWSIFDFLMPGYFEDLSLFKSKYLSNNEYTKIIAKRVAPFILRRTKKEVLKDLPSKFERIISCEMTEDQRLIYDAHILDAKEKIDSGSSSFELLPYLTRLRQICIDPKLFIENYQSDSGKMIELTNIINEYKNEHKILIFSSFVGALNRVASILEENNVKYFMLTGDTKIEERKRLVEEFNANSSIKVFLISLKAGGTGLNLVGADTVIHLDPWWNVSAENQASDRAHRIGQIRNVEVIKFVALNSVEERVIELQNLKKDIIDKVISNDDSSITNFSMDDLRYILR